MNDDMNKRVFAGIAIVALLIVIVIEFSKINRYSYKPSDFVKYDEKYEGLENQISYKKITDLDMAQKYLADFVNTIDEDRRKAYSLVDTYYKERKMKNISDFNKKINSIESNMFYAAKVTNYNVVYNNKNKYYYVQDANGNIFIFKENSIMNYTVFLDASNLDF